jgi:serine/threonine-protein kinase
MAPEQILGMQLDGRADLYSLGCSAWWLLVGNELFSREAGEATLHRMHMLEPVPSLRAHVTGWCPEELERVLEACLAKDPADRPANARELAARLRAIEIPDEYAWTPPRAVAWWQSYQPPAPPPSVPSRDVQLIVPGRTGRPAATRIDASGAPTIHDVHRR